MNRFTDFLVNEISNDGKIVNLTNIKGEMPLLKSNEILESNESNENLESKELKTAKNAFCEFFFCDNDENAQSEVDKILEFATQTLNGETKNDFRFEITGKSKEFRGGVHKLIRKYFEHLRSETIQSQEKSFIRIWCGTDKYDLKNKQDSRFISCVLYKENKDTTEAINLISKFFNLRPNLVRFSGTKDKRAVTCQKISLPWIAPQRLMSFNERFFNLKLGNFEQLSKALKLGDLKGNHFEVVLRQLKMVSLEPQDENNVIEKINKICQDFQKSGFINYYGMQRFGTGTIRTHHIGKECLKANWEKVVDLILKPRPGERSDASEAREYYQSTKDIPGTLSKLPKFMLNEKNLLKSLEQNPNDFLGAINRLSRPMRLMYAHAYQSYIWNEAASSRIELYGSQVVVGDLIIEDPTILENELDIVPEIENEFISDLETSSDKKIEIKIVSSESEASKYSINQVVLPLPGSDIIVPTNKIGNIITDLLEKDGLDMHFKIDKEFHLKGNYRHLICKPTNYKFKIIHYENEESDLVATDLQKLMKQNIELDANYQIGTKLALYLSFELPSSAYASMLIRELTKQPLDQAYLRESSKK